MVRERQALKNHTVQPSHFTDEVTEGQGGEVI